MKLARPRRGPPCRYPGRERRNPWPPTPSPEALLLDCLHRLFVVAKADSWRAAWPQTLTPTQIAIIRVMRTSWRPLDLTEIASALHCSLPTVSRSVRALEEKCLVRRERDRWDRRRVLVVPQAVGSPDDIWDPGHGEILPGRIADLDEREMVAIRRAVEILLDRVAHRGRAAVPHGSRTPAPEPARAPVTR